MSGLWSWHCYSWVCEIVLEKQLTIIINVIRAIQPHLTFHPLSACQLSRDILCTIISWFKNIWCKANNVSCFFVSVCMYRNKTLHMIHCHVLMGNTMLNHLRQESQRCRVTRKSCGGRPGPTTESRTCLVCCIQHYYWRSSTLNRYNCYQTA